MTQPHAQLPPSPAAPQPATPAAAAAASNQTTTKECWAWRCSACARECVPVRSQSRCLCGHRLANHTTGDGHACATAGCRCPRFFFIVAEGAWVLKCRCKHKHTEHSVTPPHGCSKTGCGCGGFDSPWVCNCDHPWAAHEQVLVTRQVMTLGGMMAQQQQQGSAPGGTAAEALTEGDLVCEVNRFDMLQRGKAAGSS